MKIKAYCCKECDEMEAEHETNHYGNIYNIFCVNCDKLTEWYCIDEKPPNAWIPPPWKASEIKLTKPCDHNFSIKYRIDQPNVIYCSACGHKWRE